MSKKRHLNPVPPQGGEPAHRGYFERVELPTGGQRNIDKLLYELARFAFPDALAGYEWSFDHRFGHRFFVTVRMGDKLSQADLEAGVIAVKRSLLALGIIKTAAPPPASTPIESSPSPPPQSPPT